MREITVKAYKFDELSEEAQERALNDLRWVNVDGDWYEDVYYTICTAGKLLGLDIDRIHFDTDLYCIFDASYEYARGAAKAVKAEFPQNTDLHKIASELQALQKRHFYSLSCAVREARSMNQYSCFRFGEDYECEDLGDIIDDFAHWARILLRDEYEWLTSDEAVKEIIIINEYEFDEAGNLL